MVFPKEEFKPNLEYSTFSTPGMSRLFKLCAGGNTTDQSRGVMRESRKLQAQQAAKVAAVNAEAGAAGRNEGTPRNDEAVTKRTSKLADTTPVAAVTATAPRATTATTAEAPPVAVGTTENGEATDNGEEVFFFPAKTKAKQTGKRADGEKLREALLPLDAAAPRHGESSEVAEGYAARVSRGEAVVEVETAAAASRTMAMIRARGRATIRAEMEKGGAGGGCEGRRRGEVRGKGAGVAETTAREGEGAVPRPLEEEG